jgi:hypothetical protein
MSWRYVKNFKIVLASAGKAWVKYWVEDDNTAVAVNENHTMIFKVSDWSCIYSSWQFEELGQFTNCIFKLIAPGNTETGFELLKRCGILPRPHMVL